MASLLQRAKQQIARRKEEETTQAISKEEETIQTIPQEERDKIYSEIDKAVASNKLKIEKDTFSFTPISNDVKMPVLINIGAFIIITVLSVGFYFLFNQAETNIVSEKESVLSAEGMLIQALREESEKKLGDKEKEILNIQNRLEGMRDEQQKLISETEERNRLIEADLKEKYENELEAERLKLQNEGLSSTDIEQRLQEFEALKQKAFDDQIALMKKQLEEEQLERENALNNLIAGYEQNLETAETNRLELEEELKKEYSEKEQLLEDERDTAVTRLARLDEQKREEKLVIDQILSIYTRINNLIVNTQYEDALLNLDNLEELLNQKNVFSLPAIQYRREVDFFMIQSLRRLVESEKKADEVDTGSLIESANLIASVSSLVEKGNRYFEEGDLELARESYINAISKVPALEDGFTSLKNIEEQDLEEEREKFLLGVTEGDRYFKTKDFKSAIEKYRQALEFVETDSNVVDRIVTQLVDAGLGIETSGGNTLVSSRELAQLNEAKIQQQVRENLVTELTVIEEEYNSSAISDINSNNHTKNLLFLLDTKILLKEVIASDSIREEYPDLHEKMELYLNAYGKEKEQEGRDAALKEIVAITEYLSKYSESDATGMSIHTLEEEQQRRLFLQFLQNLKGLFELGG